MRTRADPSVLLGRAAVARRIVQRAPRSIRIDRSFGKGQRIGAFDLSHFILIQCRELTGEGSLR